MSKSCGNTGHVGVGGNEKAHDQANAGRQLHPLKLGTSWGREFIDVDRPSTPVPSKMDDFVIAEVELERATVAGRGGEVSILRERTARAVLTMALFSQRGWVGWDASSKTRW